ncbi:MAG: DUF4423 domain-containing protein [Muribaculum sp.]|nr:DUF4423 domain-containing protein [Muribaculum sp.]
MILPPVLRMANLKVLMMGGRRCGKTSALASLFDQMIHGKTNEVLTVCDKTILSSKEGEKQDSLTNKRLELEHFIAKGGNNTFLVDKSPTNSFWDYTLQLQIPGTTKRMDIVFRDSAGEFFDAGGIHHNEVVEFVKDCDVFVVVIDTPYLMAGNKVEAEAANVIDSIHTFLMQIDNQNGRKAKQVIFVPIKCERWVKDGKIDEVISTIENYYSATIQDLKASNKTEISIIPIQTAGDILFADLREPYILFNTITNKQTRCSKISDRLVTLNDGKNHKVADTEILNEDPEGIFIVGGAQTGITRRAAWFNLPNDHKAQYSPYNCEQLPLHIIRFMFNKKKSEAPTGLIAWLANFLFGTITAKDMQDAIDKLSQENLIKDSGEGIKIIKKCF